MKKFLVFLFSVLLVFSISGIAGATLVTWDDGIGDWVESTGGYSIPEGYGAIASSTVSLEAYGLNHSEYFYWTIEDLSFIPDAVYDEVLKLDIVFHGIHDWTFEDDALNVFIRDGEAPNDSNLTPLDFFGTPQEGWLHGIDDGDNFIPVFDTTWTHLGSWSDDDGWVSWGDPSSGPVYDLVFSLTIDDSWKEKLTNGGSFTIGIDPDCHYYFDDINVYAPVPEPATMLLLGSGLIGLAGFGRRKFIKK